MFWRHSLQRKYNNYKEWSDWPTDFSELSPDEYYKRISNGSETEWRIIVSHEVSEDDFKNRRLYSIPISQYIFHPFFIKL